MRTDISAEEIGNFLMDGFEGSLLRMQIEGSTDPLRQFHSLVLDQFFRPSAA